MVRAKGRRKIVVQGRCYVWYCNNWETPFLHIVSEDKRLILSLPLNAPKPYAVSKGREFQGRPSSGCWERYILPFDIPESVTPRFVAEVIEWANLGDGAVRTEYSAEFRF